MGKWAPTYVFSTEQLLVSPGAIPSGEDDGRQGAFKRFSAMWSSLRKGKRDSEYYPVENWFLKVPLDIWTRRD